MNCLVRASLLHRQGQSLRNSHPHASTCHMRIAGSSFKDKIGSNEDESSGGESVLNALWVAHTLLSKAPRAVKRVTIFTQSTDPTAGNKHKRCMNQVVGMYALQNLMAITSACSCHSGGAQMELHELDGAICVRLSETWCSECCVSVGER